MSTYYIAYFAGILKPDRINTVWIHNFDPEEKRKSSGNFFLLFKNVVLYVVKKLSSLKSCFFLLLLKEHEPKEWSTINTKPYGQFIRISQFRFKTFYYNYFAPASLVTNPTDDKVVGIKKTMLPTNKIQDRMIYKIFHYNLLV